MTSWCGMGHECLWYTSALGQPTNPCYLPLPCFMWSQIDWLMNWRTMIYSVSFQWVLWYMWVRSFSDFRRFCWKTSSASGPPISLDIQQLQSSLLPSKPLFSSTVTTKYPLRNIRSCTRILTDNQPEKRRTWFLISIKSNDLFILFSLKSQFVTQSRDFSGRN